MDAYFGDSPVVAYYVERTSLGVRGAPVSPIPFGIAVRKSDTAGGHPAGDQRMYRDGTMKRILAKWRMSGDGAQVVG